MRILLAVSSFKTTLASRQACEAAEIGLRQEMPGATIVTAPVSDGGDGFLDALIPGLKARKLTVSVTGPLGENLEAEYILAPFRGKKSAFIESARICGLSLVPEGRRNPILTTSYGVGQAMIHAIGRRAQAIYIGVGGTATQDGGAGMAQALGIGLWDSQNKSIGFGCGWLSALAGISMKKRDPRLRKVPVFAVTDVTNHLLGPQGTAKVYAPQKGATPGQVSSIEANLEHFSQIIKRDLDVNIAKIPGAGAGGGLGAGLIAFCQAKILPGAQTVLEVMGADKLIKSVDVVIVGEGRLDRQTLYGKAPQALAKLARAAGKKVYGLFGQVEQDPADVAKQLGLAGYKELMKFAPSPESAQANASACLIKAAASLAVDLAGCRQPVGYR